jgi:hypothetical protein
MPVGFGVSACGLVVPEAMLLCDEILDRLVDLSVIHERFLS